MKCKLVIEFGYADYEGHCETHFNPAWDGEKWVDEGNASFTGSLEDIHDWFHDHRIQEGDIVMYTDMGRVLDAVDDMLREIDLEALWGFFHAKNETIKATVYPITGYPDDEANVANLNKFLELYPDWTVKYESVMAGSRPEMKATNIINAIQVELNFGYSVCEQRQVGTRKVMRFAEEDIKDLEMVEVEEPVYEYFCPEG